MSDPSRDPRVPVGLDPAEIARQVRLLAEWEATPEGQAEMAWLDAFAAQCWADLAELDPDE